MLESIRKNWNPHTLHVKWYRCLEKSLSFLAKLNLELPCYPAISFIGICSKEVKALGGGSGWGTHVNPWLFHFNVWQNPLQLKKKKKNWKRMSMPKHSHWMVNWSITHNNQGREIAKTLTEEQINETIYSYNETLFTHKKEWRTDSCYDNGWILKILCYVTEVRQKKAHIVWFHLCEMSRTGKSMETESKLVIARTCREEATGSDC